MDNSKMVSWAEARSALRGGAANMVHYTRRLQSGEYRDVNCWLDNDGDLVQSHPTDSGRTCLAPERSDGAHGGRKIYYLGSSEERRRRSDEAYEADSRAEHEAMERPEWTR